VTSGPLARSVALVTGAARPRGIGRASALALAAAGADVVCLDIARPYASAPDHVTGTGDDLKGAVAEIRALGRRTLAVRADVSRADEVEAAVASATEALGTITLVANVAGEAARALASVRSSPSTRRNSVTSLT
jgi:NAD(P)-dependent dehydrogenase (short-subunit alcohol dehydrogenase family)